MADGVAAITKAFEEVFEDIANKKYVFWVNIHKLKEYVRLRYFINLE